MKYVAGKGAYFVNPNNIKSIDISASLSKNKLIHAYGPMKKVIIMNIKKTIDRIHRTANLKVTSIIFLK